MLVACVLVPLVAGIFILAVPDPRGVWRAWTPPAVGFVHAAIVASLWNGGESPVRGMLGLDALGLVFLSLTSAVFLPTVLHPALCALRPESEAPENGSGPLSARCAGSAKQSAAWLFFLAAASCLCCVSNIAAMIICLELATLATLFPVHEGGDAQAGGRRRWAVWGIACVATLAGLALLAFSGGFGILSSARETAATASAPDKTALKAAFACILLGCGAKMGLAPMHAWLARLQGAAAAPVSALQAGALSACALLPVLRILSVVRAAGEGGYAELALRLVGVATLALAALFLHARDSYTGMLGYSTAGHMGLAVFGAGLGSAGVWLALWHVAAHSLAKSSLFLVSGAIAGRYGTRRIDDVAGLRQAMPGNGMLWLVGAAALGCLPPFALFYSQFGMLADAVFARRRLETCLVALFMFLAFAGMLRSALSMLRGGASGVKRGERLAGLVCPCLLMAAVLILGMGAPAALAKILDEAVRLVEPAFAGVPGIRAF